MNKLTIKEGPLTERQIQILDGLVSGQTQKHIATTLKAPVPADGTPAPAYGVNVGVVRQEVATIKTKMGADTTAEAVARYATAMACRNAAAHILSHRILSPLDATEDHVNQVLKDLAESFQDWSAQRLPQ